MKNCKRTTMKYCFDLDDVISNTYVELMKSSMRYHIEILKNTYVCREIEKAQGNYAYFYKALEWGEDEVNGFFHSEYPFFLDECVPNESVIGVVNELYEKGNEIHILSAREERGKCVVYEKTRKWLEKWGVQFNKLLIDTSTKSVYLKDNEIDVFVDDLWDNCVDAKQNSSSIVCHVRCEYNRGVDYDYSNGIVEIEDVDKLMNVLNSLF